MNNIKDMYLSGMSVQDIGDSLNLSETTIRKRLIKNGVQMRSNSRKGRKNKTYKPLSEYFNTKHGCLTIIGQQENKFICKCDCGNTVLLEKRRLYSDKQKTCGCFLSARGSNNKRWKGLKHISASYFNSIKNDALKRGLLFDITIENMEQTLIKQNFVCALSGLRIQLVSTRPHENNTASLDRIDSSKGYTIDNIQWLHKMVNEMKWDHKQSDFIEMCRLIALKNPPIS